MRRFLRGCAIVIVVMGGLSDGTSVVRRVVASSVSDVEDSRKMLASSGKQRRVRRARVARVSMASLRTTGTAVVACVA
jgi:hypothetical protein